AAVEYAKRNRRTVTLVVVGLVLIALVFVSSPQYAIADGIIVLLKIGPEGRLAKIVSPSWLVTMGRYSYFLYLMHMPIWSYVGSAHAGGSEHTPAGAGAICYLSCCPPPGPPGDSSSRHS